ncbi:unnamed protein product [Commensalibacter communis]|uniref:Uncharacterized protein n=1 Tax=Commensalibacter communis TaxID=2972786 RepID=A0A9W4TNE4_9PROT|nr:hypothetical protein [Commensalibacter communis]CAI3928087.1 unnamed protein product [Commensalibacter communis]CAI3928657.1 unnamed protein product [Commensalibacter communis]CAI3932788.1 unnamed protein product [Commensalibacter communis]CAI3934337.1 unnamed protein product [Commensalibacter communis]CAI3940755.1 unnamed protein product [Commensalibacter communis]
MTNPIRRLCKDLNLPSGDAHTQDWAYELPNEYRTQEWLDQYISAYSAIKCFDMRRDILMDLMLDIVNNYLLEGLDSDIYIIQQVLELLRANKIEHQDTIAYWSVVGEDDPEAYFEVTPFVREIAK